MRKGSPQSIGDVLQGVVEELHHTKRKEAAQIFSAWASCAGKEFIRHTRPAHLHKGALLVNVEDSAWFYQINLKKDKLLVALKKKLGQNKIKRIQFRIGKTR